MSDTILVLGGTGLLGEPVARTLRVDGFEVRLMARDPSKALKRCGSGFDIVAGDVTSVESLSDAIRGCRGIHISIAGPAEQVCAENVSALAAHGGVERVTYLSGSTVAEENAWFPMVGQKLAAEKAIRESGVPYTIFRPTWPFETLRRFVRDGRATMIGSVSTPYHWFAADDLARMVSTAYRREEAANAVLYVHGPEAIRMKEALERYCRSDHPEIRSVTSMPTWAARLLGRITRKEALVFAAELMAYFEKVGEPGDPTEANRLLGAPMTTLDEWIRAQVDD